jgi:hypothetical protein
MFISEGLNIKEVKDLFNNFIENDLTPDQWVAQMKSLNKDFDARCPIFYEKRYIWAKVKVICYD